MDVLRCCVGHEVAFASDESMRQRVERLRFDFFPAGGDWRALLFERHPELTFTSSVAGWRTELFQHAARLSSTPQIQHDVSPSSMI